MSSVAESVLGRFFTAGLLAANPPEVARIRRVLLGADRAGYAGCCAAIRDLDQTALLSSIRMPVLIIAGDHDVSTPWTGQGEALAREIPHAAVVHLPTAHLSNLARPRSFTAALFRLLLPPPGDPLAAGFSRRRATIGDDYVDRAISATTDFTRAFQDLLTRVAWGSVWQRPGLDDRTRRLLVLTSTAILGRWEEFRMHVRAGLDRGVEPCDIEEAFLQLAIYAGFPTANHAFRIAGEEMSRS
jgi:3-oxoadipate enol-lactonase/4-carboxymuconolactone decarboxylase